MLKPLDISGLKVGEGMPALNLEQYMGLWAIEETAAMQLWQMVTSMDLASHVRTGTVQANPTVDSTEDNIAIIQIRGTMTKSGSSLSGAGSTVKTRQQIRAAANDPNVDGIFLVIDSPGGTVSGTAELGDEVASAAAKKPVVTFAEDLMASAGLWVGSQANAVFANSDHAVVGSKGVFMGLYDYSGNAAQNGIKPVLIRTGDLKGNGFPGTEVTVAQQAMWQTMIDGANASFDRAMSKRKLSPESLQELSRGGVFTAKAATSMGLIDGIRSPDGALSELRSMIGQKKGKRKATMSESTLSATASLKDLEAACVGASADFLLNQLRVGATVNSAQSAWMASMDATLKAANQNLSTLTDKFNASEASLKETREKLTASEAKVTELSAQIKESNDTIAALRKGGSFKPMVDVGKGKPALESKGDTSDQGASATDQWNAQVKELMSAGMSKQAAVQKLANQNPELRAAYVAEANAAAGR